MAGLKRWMAGERSQQRRLDRFNRRNERQQQSLRKAIFYCTSKDPKEEMAQVADLVGCKFKLHF